jgi:hypothetical protein
MVRIEREDGLCLDYVRFADRTRGPSWLRTGVHRLSCFTPFRDDLLMEHRTQLHDTLSEAERRRSRPEVVLTEEDRPIRSIRTNQSEVCWTWQRTDFENS